MGKHCALSMAILLAFVSTAVNGASVANGAHARCTGVLAAIADRTADVVCFDSADLTTNNPATTPANNSLPGLPPLAFTPITDRAVISPNPPYRTPITRAVPGIQVSGRFADDPSGEARFLLRFPDDWNGKLVVAGASGTRSEFNGDFAWSDYVIQKGYAYASQNKGILNLRLVSASAAVPPSSSACRLNPNSHVWVDFYDDDPAKPFALWTQYIIEGARLAQVAVKGHYNAFPRRTYAVGTSNGGYQVRRAVEAAPDLFDGGVDWEGTLIHPLFNVLIDLPPAIKNFPTYVTSGFDPESAAAQAIEAAGYPPDLTTTVGGKTVSLWGLYWSQFWEVTQCQWQKRFDPGWTTYTDGAGNVDGTGGYDYFARAAADPSILAHVAAVSNTGKIKKPLITVAGTMDALLPIRRGARAYEALVNASREGNNAEREAQYRLYEVQNGNHIETFKDAFPQLEFIQPHAQHAFDLLVDHVENRAPLPPGQCIPKGGAVSASPNDPGHCPRLFVP
ncbi:MAG TPA: 3-hydroxybutyrate oligomer hydrolase family protein [bacterium]|nr:3-hydroxybutyrate oligomer hydrolase family protein [bacterium]